MTIFKHLIVTCLFFIWSLSPATAVKADTEARGQVVGGSVHVAPDWFKESFLEIQDDVDEATEENRHVLLFFQLNGCPYCDRMLSESFESEPTTRFIQQNFDTIAINIKGDRDIAFDEETQVTEKELSEILKVRATPAILFLNKDNKTVVRVNGYRAPQRFRQVLNYVSSKSYETESLADFLDKNLAKNVYQLRENKHFKNISDLSSIKGPLALIFEDKSCNDCDEFHERTLSKTDVQKELEAFTLVRIDTDSEAPVIDVDGSTISARALAKKYNMLYRPGVLLFDEGKLVRRYDSLLFSYHFKEGFRYVSGGYYKNEDYDSYSQKRTEELLAAGISIDLSN